MKRFKLAVLSMSALFVSGLREQFSTANANDKGTLPSDPTTDLLCKGAGVDPKDVYWRVRAGLSPKQAVEVAVQEKFEAQLEDFTKANEKKSDADIREMAEDAGIEVNPNMSRNQLLIAILRKQNESDAPSETTSGEPKTVEDMTVPELKAHAAKHDVDIAGLKTKDEIRAAIQEQSRQ